MPENAVPDKLRTLHAQEEFLRDRALEVVAVDRSLRLHLVVIERAMDMLDQFRQIDTDDEDMKVIQMLAMRTFTAFGASLKLALSGYGQNSVLAMRDILETIYLVDLFQGDRAQITRWRLAEGKDRWRNFKPSEMRKALDKRDGVLGKKRAARYQLFSELAAHPNMKSHLMMRPRPDWDAVSGPFLEAGALSAVVSEMGRSAVEIGDVVDPFFPEDGGEVRPVRAEYRRARAIWFKTFFPKKPPPAATS